MKFQGNAKHSISIAFHGFHVDMKFLENAKHYIFMAFHGFHASWNSWKMLSITFSWHFIFHKNFMCLFPTNFTAVSWVPKFMTISDDHESSLNFFHGHFHVQLNISYHYNKIFMDKLPSSGYICIYVGRSCFRAPGAWNELPMVKPQQVAHGIVEASTWGHSECHDEYPLSLRMLSIVMLSVSWLSCGLKGAYDRLGSTRRVSWPWWIAVSTWSTYG